MFQKSVPALITFSVNLSIVAEIHEDLEKAKKESQKDRIPPRAPKDKPTVVEDRDDTLQYDIMLSLLYGVIFLLDDNAV